MSLSEKKPWQCHTPHTWMNAALHGEKGLGHYDATVPLRTG